MAYNRFAFRENPVNTGCLDLRVGGRMSIVNNSRMGRILPDVEPEKSPLVDRLLALIGQLGDGAIALADFHI